MISVLHQQSETLETLATMTTMTTAVMSFFALVRERRAGELDAWVAQAKASDVPELVAFGEGLRRDEAAVRAACTSPWSQPLEIAQAPDVRPRWL